MGVITNFISGGSLGGSVLLAVGEKYAVVCHDADKTVRRVDLTNLVNPSVSETQAWGYSWKHSGFQTTAGSMIYYGDNRTHSGGIYGSYSGNLTGIRINPTNGAMTLIDSITTATTTEIRRFLNKTNVWIMAKDNAEVFSGTAHTSVLTYGSSYFFNGTINYSTGNAPGTASTATGFLYYHTGALQISSTELLIYMRGSSDMNPGLCRMNASGWSRIYATYSGVPTMYDNGNILWVAGNRITLVNGGFGQLGAYVCDTGRNCILLGRLGDYYYVIDYPSTATQDGEVLLKILQKDNLDLFFAQQLPADPFDAYDGMTTMYNNLKVTPHVSQSGYVGAIEEYNASSRPNFHLLRFGDFTG